MQEEEDIGVKSGGRGRGTVLPPRSCFFFFVKGFNQKSYFQSYCYHLQRQIKAKKFTIEILNFYDPFSIILPDFTQKVAAIDFFPFLSSCSLISVAVMRLRTLRDYSDITSVFMSVKLTYEPSCPSVVRFVVRSISWLVGSHNFL